MQVELFKNQEHLSRPLYTQLAGDIKLDVDRFNKCLDTLPAKQYVRDDLAFATKLGVHPGIIVGQTALCEIGTSAINQQRRFY